MRKPPHGIAAELRRLRLEAGRRIEDVASDVGWNKSSVSRLETGVTPVQPRHVAELAGPLRLTPVARMRLERMLGIVREPDQWWVRYHEVLSDRYEELIYLESRARSIAVASTLVPGPMQCEGYARATMMRSAFVPDPDDAEMLLEVRLQRRQVITNGSAQMAVTLSEAALWQRFCGPVALQAQLHHLVELSRLDNVSLRIVPFDALIAPSLGPITVLTLPEADSTVAHVEYEGGSQLLKDARSIKRYRRSLEYVRLAAATEEESRQMILKRLDVL
ncbi:helix-turn-helix transcriptional regulator [Embleya sp. NPDC005575]|uniref:helix-turn-helix domain-containing protein n=1 Tax=Embleya sp. NPDC005575 TaxID=3156892 RepID=UPI0033B87723